MLDVHLNRGDDEDDDDDEHDDSEDGDVTAALDGGHIDVMAVFIEHCLEPVDFNACDTNGQTVTQLAHAKCNESLIQLLRRNHTGT